MEAPPSIPDLSQRAREGAHIILEGLVDDNYLGRRDNYVVWKKLETRVPDNALALPSFSGLNRLIGRPST